MTVVKDLFATDWLDEDAIDTLLARGGEGGAGQVRDAIARACDLDGLGDGEVATLAAVEDAALLEEMFAAARAVKETIHGRRVVFSAPLSLGRSRAGIEARAAALIEEGHRRVLLDANAVSSGPDVDRLLDAVAAIRAAKGEKGEIRRLDVNVAPLSVEDFARLRQAGIATCQTFQDSYRRSACLGARAMDFDGRLSGLDRAMAAGIDDVGLGPLFGPRDWRFETLALTRHLRHLERNFGAGCRTVVLRRRHGAAAPHGLSDADFKKIVAILRLALPHAEILMSMREGPAVRAAGLAAGVSQVVGDGPGGLDEAVGEVVGLGFVPSFCTACPRLSRTGARFMELATTGLIRAHCAPNALASLLEYLQDHASPATRAAGALTIEAELRALTPPVRRCAEAMMGRVQGGLRDVFC